MNQQQKLVSGRFSRRILLKGAALGIGSLACGRVFGRPSGPRSRPDLLDEKSPKGLEVIQLTTETEVPSAHLYMEAQIFTMDSKRFVLHRSASAHGGSKSDPKHQYLLCDIENGFSLSTVIFAP